MFARLPSLSLSLALLALSALLLVQAPPSAASPPVAPPSAPAWDVCYRTNEQITSYLQSVAAAHPQIATVSDAGLSWEGTRHLWLMRLGSGGGPGIEPRPTIFLLAGQHPRDIATIEVLVRFIGHMTGNYGTDPNVTWLLDHRWIYVLPVPNPDGYFQIYSNRSTWFKNTNNGNGCGDALKWGTDLNRNYPYKWNNGGTSNLPCDSSYRGPSALSEPESQHVLAAFQASGRPADLTISLQAPGPSVLYPWGWTSTPPVDAAELDAFAWSLGRLNGTSRANIHRHNPGNSPISGILDDTVYGQFGAPAFTLNIGNISAPVCTDLEQVWTSQRPALLHAIGAAGTGKDDTLSHAFGPQVTQVSTSQGESPWVVNVSAVLSANYGTVAEAVYTVDGNPENGPTFPMSGDFGAATASVTAQVDAGGLAPGRHLLSVRGKNDSGQWGLSSSVFFTTTAPPPTATPTASRTATITATAISAATASNTPSVSNSATSTPTPTPAVTQTPTEPPTGTPTATLTGTSTAISITETATHTPTRTVTPTTTAPSGTNTATPTRTPTVDATFTPTLTSTRTHTPTRSVTPTRTLTPTRTPTYTRTVGPTHTPRPPATPTPLPCTDYDDVGPNQFFYGAVDWLTCRGIVSGYSDNTFRPGNTATRAQIVKMVVLGHEWPLYAPEQPTFSDVRPGDWSYPYVEAGVSHGIIGGYADGSFGPNNPVTRGQLCKILVLAGQWPLASPSEPHFTDVPPGSPFYPYVETAHALGIVSGYADSTFRPSNHATRGQLSKMLYVALTRP